MFAENSSLAWFYEETFRWGLAVAAAAHAGLQVVLKKEGLPLPVGGPALMVRMGLAEICR